MIIPKIENMKNRTLNDFSNMLKKSSMFAKKHNIRVSGDGEGCDIYVIPAHYLQNFSDTLDENFDKLIDAALDENFDKLIDAAEMEKNSGKDIDSDFYFPCGGLSYDK